MNRRYGFTKFIIVVPSIAIKEGTKKSLEITKEHFKGEFENVVYDYFVYDSAKLEQKNKYEVFLGGNYDKVVIDTVSIRATLLIIKDSYANALIPMLTPYFAKIVVVDPRYMTESIHNTMDEYNFSHVLFLYNLNTFLQDTSLEDALK